MEEQSTKKRLLWKDLEAKNVDLKLSLLGNHLEVSRILINELLEEEVFQKAGKWYGRKAEACNYCRWGSNPGSVKIGDRKLKVEVPRLMDKESGKSVPLQRYAQMKELDHPSEELQAKVIKGLSTRDYSDITDNLLDSFGLSKSSISDQAKQKMVENLRHFEHRDLSAYDITAIILDGKYLQKHQVIIALGITISGEKIALGFVQSGSENGKVVKELLIDLGSRGLKHDQGLLVVLDGSKGLSKGVKDYFGPYALIQRCRWHKRENVLSYLKQEDKEAIKNRFDVAVNRMGYEDAYADLMSLHNDLKDYNRSAASSLLEGMPELLTLHKLGLNEKFKRSFGTTNSIESLNSQIGKYIRKVKRWYNSDMIYRWMATALMEIEPKLRKVANAKHLPLLRKELQNALDFSTKNWT